MLGLGHSSRAGQIKLGPRVPPAAVYAAPNVLVYPHITADSEWQESSSNVTKTYGVADRLGRPQATKITLDGVDNHHQWIDLPEPLIEGHSHKITVEVNPDTTEGYSDAFQIAYYDDTGQIAGSDVPVTVGAGWQTLEVAFTAPAYSGTPSIRILGWGNGAQGESIIIGEIVATDLDLTYTAEGAGAGVAVASADISTHTLPPATYFYLPPPKNRSFAIGWEGQPAGTDVPTVLERDFGVDLTADGVWDLDATEIRPQTEAPFLQRFFRTHMEKDSYTSTTSMIRGTGWENIVISENRATLTYYVRFKPGYEWVKGGKLPGLYGGDSPSGGASTANGFSTRMMWRKDGQGELYLYAMNKSNQYGDSIGRGAFYFVSGRWTKVTQEVILNDVGYDNGVARVWIDDVPVFELDGIIYRDSTAVMINGIMSTIFFGGSNSTWAATRDEYVDHGNYVIRVPTAA